MVSERPPKKKVDPKVKAITGAIWARWTDLHPDTTLKEFAKAAGSRESTWAGWRNGSRKPRLLELWAWAEAAEMNLAAINDGETQVSAAGVKMTSRTRQMIAVMESLTDAGRADVLEMAMTYKRTMGSSNPQEPVSEMEPTADRQR